MSINKEYHWINNNIINKTIYQQGIYNHEITYVIYLEIS